jgi:hypothetical protein
MSLLSSRSAALPPDECAPQPARQRFYSDRQNYKELGEYAVAEGCLEHEVMMQISCDIAGDFLFGNVFDTSDRTRQPVPYASLTPCSRSIIAQAACTLFLCRSSPQLKLLASSSFAVRWRSPPAPVADGGAVVEKSVYGILRETRLLWVQLLCGQQPDQHPSPADVAVSSRGRSDDAAACPHPNGDAAAAQQLLPDTVSSDEAQSFISRVIQPCINLMHVNDSRQLMTLALGCVAAWLSVRSSSSFPTNRPPPPPPPPCIAHHSSLPLLRANPLPTPRTPRV